MKVHKDPKFKQDLEAEFDRMMVVREKLFDELDQFPRNARADAKRKRMDRRIARIKKTLREFD